MSEELEYTIRIAELIIQHYRGELSSQGSLELKVWCAQSEKNQALFDRLGDSDFIKQEIRQIPDIQLLKKAGWDRVVSAIGNMDQGDAAQSAVLAMPAVKSARSAAGSAMGTESVEADASVMPGDSVTPMPVKRSGWVRYAVAASVMGLIAVGGWMLLRHGSNSAGPEPVLASRFKNDVAPGTHKALLTLADGSSLPLDNQGKGRIAQQAGTEVNKNAGTLSYVAAASGKQSPLVYNTLTTPAGSEYTVTLPDGSRVWLNNSSSLKYPVAFTGKERVVELQGEAYFEIEKNVAQPFKVKVGGMMLDVLGTSFNISAYTNEAEIKTTLLTGAVRVSRGSESQVMQPGEQVLAAADGAGSFTTNTNIETEGVIAWKNGLFHFERADIQRVMRVLARWYDVEVVYSGAIPSHVFGGDIQRNLNLTQVLEILQKNQVHFDLEGRKITVRP